MKVKIGDTVKWRGGFGNDEPKLAVVRGVTVTAMRRDKYGDEVEEADESLVAQNRVVFDLDSGHWAYSDQIELMPLCNLDVAEELVTQQTITHQQLQAKYHQQTYLDLSHQHRDLQLLGENYDTDDQDTRDKYHMAEDALKAALRNSVTASFLTKLNKKQLLYICSLCSTFRPFQPHSFLGMLGLAYQEVESGQGG